MSGPAWEGAEDMEYTRARGLGILRVVVRGVLTFVIVFGGLAIYLIVRLPESLFHGRDRPWTPFITQAVCILALHTLGIERRVTGHVMKERGAIVANHGSWLDIFALNATARVVFTAKSEVAQWPGIGWLARATGTLFVRRDRASAQREATAFEERLRAGERVLFFPEGTSTDGRRVLQFKPTLFAAFYAEGLPADLYVQPVTVFYAAPRGKDARFYGWWGDMTFGGHLLHVLSSRRQGAVEIIWHSPLRVADHVDRKALARASETAVRDAFEARLARQISEPRGQTG